MNDLQTRETNQVFQVIMMLYAYPVIPIAGEFSRFQESSGIVPSKFMPVEHTIVVKLHIEIERRFTRRIAYRPNSAKRKAIIVLNSLFESSSDGVRDEPQIGSATYAREVIFTHRRYRL